MKIYENSYDLNAEEICSLCYGGMTELWLELNDDEKFYKILDYLSPLLPEYISVAEFSTILEIELRTAIAERDEVDELDYFIKLFEDFTLDDLKYDPSKYEYAKEFAEEHGLV